LMSHDFQPGAHLRDERTWYGHDGVYLGPHGGDDWVMQFGGGGLSEKARSRIDYVPLAEFQKSGRVTVVEHEGQDFEATLRRAAWLIENPPPMPYHLIGHNCEHIARWCAMGNFSSRQVEGLLGLNLGVGAFFTLVEQPGGAWRLVVGLVSLFLSLFMMWLSDRGARRFREHIEQNWPG